MKKIITLLLALVLVGCSSSALKLTNEAKNGVSLTAGAEFDPSTLVEVKDGTEVNYELDGNKYIITSGEEVKEVPVTYELMEIDGTLPVDLSKFYSDSSKLAKVSYAFNEDETVMTVTDENGEGLVTFEVPVHVYYPSYTIADNIEIDTYVGYNINDFVTVDEGVEVTSELDEENSILNIALSKNNWSIQEERSITISDSNPYPIIYKGLYMYSIEKADISFITFKFIDSKNIEAHSDKTGEDWTMTVGDGYLMDNDGYKHSFYIEGDYLYDYVNELSYGPQRDVQGSYMLYQRVYE